MVATLKQIFDHEIETLSESFRMFPWLEKESYALWLAQTYYLVRHTPRLLGLAAGKFGVEQEAMHRVALEGLKEESGHDQLALNDIKSLGFDLSELPELPQTAAIFQSQYYRVDYTGPISLFGYALMLEGLASSIGENLVMILSEQYGKKPVSFLRVHAVHDSDHYGEGLKALSHVSEKERDGIIQNLKQSRVLYSTLLEAIQREAGQGMEHSRLKQSA